MRSRRDPLQRPRQRMQGRVYEAAVRAACHGHNQDRNRKLGLPLSPRPSATGDAAAHQTACFRGNTEQVQLQSCQDLAWLGIRFFCRPLQAARVSAGSWTGAGTGVSQL